MSDKSDDLSTSIDDQINETVEEKIVKHKS